MGSEYFTSDKIFLTDTQKLLEASLPTSKKEYTDIEMIWREIQKETGFHAKYQYIDWPLLKWANYNTSYTPGCKHV